jgi:hypothetical protein
MLDMIELPPPRYLFAFLALYGATHAVIAQQLGVSVALVHSWSVGRRALPLARYSQLLAFAVQRAGDAHRDVPPTAPDPATRQRLLVYLHGLRAVYAERVQFAEQQATNILHRITILATFGDAHPPTSWADADMQWLLEATEGLRQRLREAMDQHLIPQGEHRARVADCDTLIRLLEDVGGEEPKEDSTHATPGQRRAISKLT